MKRKMVALLMMVLTMGVYGKDFSANDFNTIGDANWIETTNGNIIADEGKGYLVSKKKYKNFVLELEYFAAYKSNSGIFFRCLNSDQINDKDCYEANIFDTREDQSGRTGSITGRIKPRKILHTEGRWNHYYISAHGNRLLIILNGEVTIFNRNDDLSDGFIALQFIQGTIKFRNIRINSL